MILLAGLWLLQDLMQVLFLGFFVVPDLFFLGVLQRALREEDARDLLPRWVWFAFFGGLLWDLRWTSVPGITAAIQAGALTVASALWYRTPMAGRTPLLWILMAGIAHLGLGAARFLLWGDRSAAAFRLLAIQQLTALPLVLGFSLILLWRRKTHD